METKTVNHICIRSNYNDVSGYFKPDDDGVLITFGEKETTEFVQEMVIMANKKIALTDIRLFLQKTLQQIDNELMRRKNEEAKD